MIRNLTALVLLIVSATLSFRHGWDTLHYRDDPAAVRMMTQLGITGWAVPLFGALALITCILLVVPRTFFIGNVLNAMTIFVIMMLALNSGNYIMALIEIPFLILPIVMIRLGYPFKN